MANENQAPQKPGYYFGTEIGEKWWKRYTKNKMLARGNGRYWYDGDYFYFLRHLTNTPIAIPVKDIKDFKFGKWHAGKWGAGQQILKIIWLNENQMLSSGFILSKDKNETEKFISDLKNLDSNAAK